MLPVGHLPIGYFTTTTTSIIIIITATICLSFCII